MYNMQEISGAEAADILFKELLVDSRAVVTLDALAPLRRFEWLLNDEQQLKVEHAVKAASREWRMTKMDMILDADQEDGLGSHSASAASSDGRSVVAMMPSKREEMTMDVTDKVESKEEAKAAEQSAKKRAKVLAVLGKGLLGKVN